VKKTYSSIKLNELRQYFEISKRLQNILENEEILPFKTIEEYLNAGLSAKEELKKIPNLGEKSAKELEFLILKFIDGDFQIIKPTEIPEKKLSTHIYELIKYNNVSVRLNNVFEKELLTDSLAFITVSDYLLDKNTAKKYFASLDNMGKKSLEELENLITTYVDNDVINDINCQIVDKNKSMSSDYLGDNIADRDCNINKIIKSELNNNEYEILYLRAVDNLTLQEVGDRKNITRERVRQIEKKARLKFKVVSLFIKFTSKIDLILEESNGEIEVNEIGHLFKISSNMLLLMLYIYIGLTKSATRLKQGIIFRSSIETNHKNWNNEIDSYLYSSIWPIDRDKLFYHLFDIPKSYVNRYLIEKKGAEISGQLILKLNNIPRKVKVYLILKMANKPLHTSELTERFNLFFHENKNEHNIRSIVGDMDEALIVDRGIYTLYEQLNMDEVTIDDIRNKAYQFLMDKQKYISSKVIYQEIFQNKQYNSILNEYTLHGILQDDLRFLVRRGFMIGLHDFSNKIMFQSLGEQIEEIVKKYGPISVQEILDKLSSNRNIFQSNIDSYIERSNSIIKISRGLYANKNVFFETNETYTDLVIAIEIILSDELQTLLEIYEKIKNINKFKVLKITQQLILSLLTIEDIFVRSGDNFELEKYSGELKIYSKFINRKISDGVTVKELTESCNKLAANNYLKRYLAIDYRQFLSSDESSKNEDKIIDNLLNSFGF